jgi:hypothetical protein
MSRTRREWPASDQSPTPLDLDEDPEVSSGLSRGSQGTFVQAHSAAPAGFFVRSHETAETDRGSGDSAIHEGAMFGDRLGAPPRVRIEIQR